MVRFIGLISLIGLPLFAVIQGLPQEDPDFVLPWGNGTCLIYKSGGVYFLDDQGQVFNTFDVGRQGAYMAWREAGSKIVIAFFDESDGTLLAMLLPSARGIQPILRIPNKILRVLPSFRPNQLLLLTDSSRPLVLVDITRGTYTHLEPPDGGPPVFGFLGVGGRTVMSLSSQGVAHFLDVETGQSLHRSLLPDPGDVQWVSPDRSLIALASAKRLVVARRLDGSEVWRQNFVEPQRWLIGPTGQLWSHSSTDKAELLQWIWTSEGRLEGISRRLLADFRRWYLFDEGTLVCSTPEGLHIDRGLGFEILGPLNRFTVLPLPVATTLSRYQITEAVPFRLTSPTGQFIFQSRARLLEHRQDELEWFHFRDRSLIAVDPLQDKVIWRGQADHFCPYPGGSVLLWSFQQPRRLTIQQLDRPENEFVSLAFEEVQGIRLAAGEGVVHILSSRRQGTQTRYELHRLVELRRPPKLLWGREVRRSVRVSHDGQGRTVLYPVGRGYVLFSGEVAQVVSLPFEPMEIRPSVDGLWVRIEDGSIALIQSESGTILKRLYRLTSGEEVWLEKRGGGLEVTLGHHLVKDQILCSLGPSVHLPLGPHLPLLLPPHLNLHEIPLPTEAGDPRELGTEFLTN